MSDIVPSESIENKIFYLRGQKVMLDSHLAELYGETTKRLNQQVKRNLKRFPADFMFQLTEIETDSLRLQFATLKNSNRGTHRKYLPYVFTEQGVAMLSSVLRSDRAVSVNIEIMRTFVKLREILASNKALAHKLAELEQRYDSKFKVVFDAIHELMNPPLPPEPVIPPQRKIGFMTEDKTYSNPNVPKT